MGMKQAMVSLVSFAWLSTLGVSLMDKIVKCPDCGDYIQYRATDCENCGSPLIFAQPAKDIAEQLNKEHPKRAIIKIEQVTVIIADTVLLLIAASWGLIGTLLYRHRSRAPTNSRISSQPETGHAVGGVSQVRPLGTPWQKLTISVEPYKNEVLQVSLEKDDLLEFKLRQSRGFFQTTVKSENGEALTDLTMTWRNVKKPPLQLYASQDGKYLFIFADKFGDGAEIIFESRLFKHGRTLVKP